MIGKAASPRQAIIGGGIGGVLGFATGYITRALTYKAPVVIDKSPVNIEVWQHARWLKGNIVPAHWSPKIDRKMTKWSWHSCFENIPEKYKVWAIEFMGPIFLIEDSWYYAEYEGDLHKATGGIPYFLVSLMMNDGGGTCDVYMNGERIWKDMEGFHKVLSDPWRIHSARIIQETGKLHSTKVQP